MSETPKERIGRITRTEARNAPLCGDLTWLLRVCEAAIEAYTPCKDAYKDDGLTRGALETAIDGCNVMRGWTDSAVRAYDYQQAPKYLLNLQAAIEGRDA